MIGMRKVTGPEKTVASDVVDHVGGRLLVGITRNPHLRAYVLAGLLLERDRAAHPGRVAFIHAIHPEPEPRRARFQDYEAKLRKFVEHAELKEGRKRLLQNLRCHHA